MQKQRKKRIKNLIRRLNMMDSYKVYVRIYKIRKELMISQERNKRNTRRQETNFTEEKPMKDLFVSDFFWLIENRKRMAGNPAIHPFFIKSHR